jgi:hypothetical protein
VAIIASSAAVVVGEARDLFPEPFLAQSLLFAQARRYTPMPKAWSDKDERQYEHVKESEKKEGRSTEQAKEIAARTVNKHRKEEGRTKS